MVPSVELFRSAANKVKIGLGRTIELIELINMLICGLNIHLSKYISNNRLLIFFTPTIFNFGKKILYNIINGIK